MVDNTGGIIGKSSEASKGGFQGVLAVEGTLQPVKRVPSRFTENRFKPGEPNSDQAEITVTDAIITEMAEGESEPELKEGKFTTWMTYAPPNKPKPSASTFFVKGFMAYGEQLDAKRRGVAPEEGVLSNLYGTRILLKKEEVFLFKVPKPGQEGVAKEDLEYDEKSKVDFVPVEVGGDVTPEESDDYLRSKINGCVKSAAKRAMVMDTKIKSRKDYKDLVTALQDDTLAELLGGEFVGGKFVFGAKKAAAPAKAATKKAAKPAPEPEPVEEEEEVEEAPKVVKTKGSRGVAVLPAKTTAAAKTTVIRKSVKGK